MKDNLHQPCTACNEGTFEETVLYDDWRGELHCNMCGLKVKRWVKDEPPDEVTRS